MGHVSIPDNHTSKLRCQSTPAAGPCDAEQYLGIAGSLAAPRFSSGQLESAPVNPTHQILKQIEQRLSFENLKCKRSALWTSVKSYKDASTRWGKEAYEASRSACSFMTNDTNT
jgi:hypothetical protein